MILDQFSSKPKDLLLVVLLLLLFSCSEDSVENPDGELGNGNGQNDKISFSLKDNLVQKGPFVEGSSILIVELDENLESTSVSYNTETNDDFGSFDFNNELNTSNVDIIATGFYFNEITGELSSGQVTLRNFIQATAGNNSNINLLTTLSRQRIKYLINEEGASYTDAREQAEREVLLAFAIPESIIETVADFEDMDISKGGEGNAILLAISCILQGDNTDGELSELITKFANDLENDGIVNDSFVATKIVQGGLAIIPSEVKENLARRFESLNIDFEIPNFENYIDFDGNGVISGRDVTPIFPIGETLESTPLLQWNGSDQDNITYDVILATDVTFEEILIDLEGITGLEVQSDMMLDRGTTYYWAIRLVDGDDLGDWKISEFLVRDFEISNLSPSHNIINSSNPILKWDPISLEGVRYEVEISGDATFETVLFNSGQIDQTEIRTDFVLPEEGDYYWRIRYMEVSGAISDWYESSFRFELLFVVVDKSVTDFCDARPTIIWSLAHPEFVENPDNPAIWSFDIQVAEDASFSQIAFDKGNFSMATIPEDINDRFSYTFEMDFQEGITYFYRIRVTDENGVVGEWDSSSFNIEALARVTNLRPGFFIADATPRITWDPPMPFNCSISGNLTYELQISPDVPGASDTPGFTSIILEATGLEETTYQVTEPLTGGIYAFQVRYKTEDGRYSPWTGTDFGLFELLAVEAFDVFPVGTTNEVRPLFQWDEPPFTEGFPPDQRLYQLQIATNLAFTTIILDEENLISSEYQIGFDLNQDTNYYYRIRYEDGYGNFSPWSHSIGFSISN